MLFMEVTDGDTVLLAIEYEPVHELSEELPCGTKVCTYVDRFRLNLL